jgi:branched-chain amino acid transport system permease protein
MIQEVISGLEAGSWYALVGIAVVVVMKATDVPNFAMAEMGLFGAFLGHTLSDRGVPFGLAVVLAVLGGALLGVAVDVLLMRHLSGLGHFPLLLMTIGLSFALNALITLLWGSTAKQYNSPWTGKYFDLFGHTFSVAQIVCIGVGGVVAVAVTRAFASGLGAQMRAVAENRMTARTLGVNVRRVSATAWALGGAIASLAMILQTQSSALSTEAGQSIIIYAFVAATLGGFASFTGTVLGGLALGVMQNLAGSYVSTSGQSAIALLVVLALLMARPSGFTSNLQTREV